MGPPLNKGAAMREIRKKEMENADADAVLVYKDLLKKYRREKRRCERMSETYLKKADWYEREIGRLERDLAEKEKRDQEP